MKIQLSDTDLRKIARIKMLEKKCNKLKNFRRTSYRIGRIASKMLSNRKSSKLVKSVAGSALSSRANC